MIRSCPSCNAPIQYKNKKDLSRAIKQNTKCKVCFNKLAGKKRKGKQYSPDRIEKGAAKRRGTLHWTFNRSLSQEHKDKISSSLKGHKRSSETIEKCRKAAKQKLRTGNSNIRPCYNPKACLLFEEINKELGWNGIHAENGGEILIDYYFPDYYEPYYNVIIEYDEKRHNSPSIRNKDIRKEKYLINKLNCRFYRIKEGDEGNWKAIIQKDNNS